MDIAKDSELLKALGHPIRLQLVTGLMDNECNVNDIVVKLNLPQSTISQHLGILRTRGIIAPHKEGVRTCYKVVDPRIKHIISSLTNHSQ
ncbi:MAG: winged helix-turn-helix transcriptional regulator [Candidatus Omnitrophica bacterium]|nr:winged helix-turn-helix transcriptional regulator [Candidatus Omnitrophota bacterium]